MKTENRATALRTEGLSKSFSTPAGPVTLFQHLSLEVFPGTTLAIVGPSGSGKTTLMNVCAGLDEASSGEVWLLGQRLHDLAPAKRALLRRGKVGFLFQDFRLIRSLTAAENVQVPLQLAGKRRSRQAALEILGELGLAKRVDALPHQLSGGEQQRVGLARALVVDPEIVFCDEPTGSLDRDTASEVARIMFDRLKKSGATVVLATHDLELAGQCDVTLRIDSGAAKVEDAFAAG